MRHDLPGGAVGEPGALGPGHGQALEREIPGERGDIGPAEHFRPAAGQHHQPRHGVDAQLAPGLGGEILHHVDPGDPGQQPGQALAGLAGRPAR